jgi:hypothetical protein
MKVTNFGPDGLPVALGGWSTGIVSLNSNVEVIGGGPQALNFVQRITSNTSNTLLNPIVNFASGSNIAFAVQSNTLTIIGAAGGGGAAPVISAGSNSTQVREVSTAGASTTLWSPYDHAHDGIGTITASSSNTMQRGTWNIRPGSGIALSLTDTDGDGEFDTTTIVNTGSSGGGSSGAGGRGEYASKYNPDHETPATAVSFQEEFNTTTGMTWTSAPGTVDDLATYPGYYRIKGSTTARYLTKAWSPGSTDVTIACRFSASVGTTDGGGIGIYVAAQTGTPVDGVFNIFEMVSGGNLLYSLYNENASAFALVASQIIGTNRRLMRSVYLRLTRLNSGPTWTAYASLDGVTWEVIGTTGSKSLTIAAFGIRTDNNHDMSVDWVRGWTSIVERVGA